MATTLTAQYGPMMHRVWCGSFPHFHLLSDDELKQEVSTSILELSFKFDTTDFHSKPQVKFTLDQ